MTFYSLAKLQDFWLIYTQGPVGGKIVDLYLMVGDEWHWTTDVQSARRFQYSYEALTYAFDHCPIRPHVYRSELPDGHIELNFESKLCTITRAGRGSTITMETLSFLKDLAVPTPKRIALPKPKETTNAT
jgi:hypothetical protein